MGASSSTPSSPSSMPPFHRARLSADAILVPFDVTEVTLTPGSRLHSAAVANAVYMISLPVDRLLYSFRATAGLDTKGAKPLGGWEAANFGFRGHFIGHALGAFSTLSASLKATRPDLAASCLASATAMVDGFAECQKALGARMAAEGSDAPFGYLNAQSSACFDELEALKGGDVPYYVIHKIMAGLVSCYTYTGNKQALAVVSAMADYFAYRFSRLSDDTITQMINTRRYEGQTPKFFMEHGGMLDVMVDVYRLTQKDSHKALMHSFDRPWFLAMLASDDDQLGYNGEHSNTELPVVAGLCNMYRLTQTATYRTAVLNFLGWMQDGHEFTTGGVSGKSCYAAPLDYNAELFCSAKLLDRQINSTPGHQGQASGESCCAHNLQKSTIAGISWTGDARWGDEFEKRFVNSVMAQQRASDGMFLYDLNLKQGSEKGFGDETNSFWCCYGTGVEAFSNLTNGVAYHDSTSGLWLVNYIPCTINWAAVGLTCTIASDYPNPGPITLTLALKTPVTAPLHLRIPYWAVGKNSLLVNSQPVPSLVLTPGTFAVVSRQWADGDVVTLSLPYSLYYELIPDRVEYVGVKYGPHVLVACGPANAKFDGSAKALLAALKPAALPCQFTATMQGSLRAVDVTFKPIADVVGERYNGYTITSQPPITNMLDEVNVGVKDSETAHGFVGVNSTTGSTGGYSWRDAQSNGSVTYTMAVSPTKQTYLRAMYQGDDTGTATTVRLHDVQAQKADASWTVFATQSLDKEAPGQDYVVVYPLPMALTQGQSKLTLRLQAKGIFNKPGIMGAIYDKLETYTLTEAEDAEPWALVHA